MTLPSAYPELCGDLSRSARGGTSLRAYFEQFRIGIKIANGNDR